MMDRHRGIVRRILASTFVLIVCGGLPALRAQSRGLDSIRGADMKFHLDFLAAPEFRGRNVPSLELDIATRYIASVARMIGLKPLLPNGSYLQEIPVEVTRILPAGSHLRLVGAGGERKFYFPQAFGAGRYAQAGTAAGSVVFLGYGLQGPQLGWDDYDGVNVMGKIVVLLDPALPEGHALKPVENRRLLSMRAGTARTRGALAVVTIIGPDREARLRDNGLTFDNPERTRFPTIETGTGTATGRAAQPAAAGPPFLQIEVRRETGAEILGLTPAALDALFEDILAGRRPEAREGGLTLEISLAAETRRDRTFNVVAVLEGGDPRLKDEYVTIGSHHDHVAPREGRIYPGADDNISGVVGMFEIAEALMLERPRRSIVFVWHTAEEKGLIGAYHFVQHCPVPVEKISANLNLDMISRNPADHLYLIGSGKLSSELDASIRAMNDRGIGLRLDYLYDDPAHPDRFFFRSDQYPYIRYGIPGVWFFCGTTEDYHQEGDVAAKVDYVKMEKVARLVYLAAMDIGNKPGLLKLDANPEITARGRRNMAVDWQRALRDQGQRRMPAPE